VWGPGRPEDFDTETWQIVVAIIRDFRRQGQPASSRKIKAKLVRTKTVTKVPSIVTISKRVKAMGFKLYRTQDKPFINSTIMAKRLEYAKWLRHEDFSRTVFVDEKQFAQQKDPGTVLARRTSPIKRFNPKQASTDSQLTKVMYLAAVTETKKICLIEMSDFRKFNKAEALKTGTEPKKGCYCCIHTQTARKG